MLILSQTNDIEGYHGTIGTPTNMYDCKGERLYVGDVVVLTTDNENLGTEGLGTEYVCEENPNIASWTGRHYQYVMGIAGIYNNENFENLGGLDVKSDEWWEQLDKIGEDFRVYKVKDHKDLVIGEKIRFLKVVEIENN